MPIGYRPEPTGPMDRFYRAAIRVASHIGSDAESQVTQEAIAGFQCAQRLAYDAVEFVATQLHVGITEREAACMLEEFLKAHGTERFLHRPFAWFGDHSRFDGYHGYADYHPSDRRLESGDAAILDVSPIVEGYIGDVGYTVSLEPNHELDVAREFLLELRSAIPKMFASAMTPADIWANVNQRIAAAGYDNIHAKYPHCVLGHRVFQIKKKRSKPLRVGWRAFSWFSLEANLALLKMGPSAALTPEHSGNKLGFWAIEPHIGWSGGGCKFEEILVVERNRCYWLDDNVPHVRHKKR